MRTEFSKSLGWNIKMQVYDSYSNRSLLTEKIAEEGMILLKNENNSLPIKNAKVAVFGRGQIDTVFTGTGSASVTCVNRISIMDGLIKAGIDVDTKLLDLYKQWIKENPLMDMGIWGIGSHMLTDMPLDEKIMEMTKSDGCTKAIYIFSRYAGENDDSAPIKGDYYLSDEEQKRLDMIRSYYDDITVVYNSGNFLDFSFTNCKEVKSVVMAFLPGTAGSMGLGRLLKGTVSFQGKLPVTIAKEYKSYPSSDIYGAASGIMQKYTEDIYVGYRYFYTIPGKDKDVLYPFGHGLSYAKFVSECIAFESDGKKIRVKIKVKNVSKEYSGKETIMLYSSSPKTKFGTEKYALRAFKKTKMLNPGKSQILNLVFSIDDMSSFDDSGKSGFKDCYVLSKGSYKIYFGNSVDKVKVAGIYKNMKTKHGPKCTHIDTELDLRLNSNGELEEIEHIKTDPKKGIVIDPVKENVISSSTLKEVSSNSVLKKGDSFELTLKIFKVGQYMLSVNGKDKNYVDIENNGVKISDKTVFVLGNNKLVLRANKDLDLSQISLTISRNTKPIKVFADKETTFEAGAYSGNALYVVPRPFSDPDGIIKNGVGAARFFKPGRYVEYEINVEKSGIYDLYIRYCNYNEETDFSESFTLLVSNVTRDVNGVRILHTSEEDKQPVYKTAGPIKIELPEGLSILKFLSNTTQAPNFAYFTLVRTDETSLSVKSKKVVVKAQNVDDSVWVHHELNPIKNKYDLRNVLSGKITIDELICDLNPEELAMLTGGNQFDTIGYLPDRGIPEYLRADAGCGLRLETHKGPLINYPAQNMLCSSWNEELAFEQGNSIAREIVYENSGLWLSPAMNIQRSVLCGRNFEYLSEDPYLNGKIAAAICRGVNHGGAATDIKHYLANSTEYMRLQSNSVISSRAIREIYAKGFEIALKEGHPDSIMTSYNFVNGVKAAEHKGLIEGMIRKEFKFKGVVLTDFCNDSSNVKELLAGSDLKMPRGETESVANAIKDGTVPISMARKSAKRVLKMIIKYC